MKLIENLSESTKFIAMLVIYTGYLTWWASGVSVSLKGNTEDILENRQSINTHEMVDMQNTRETIRLAEHVKDLSRTVKSHDTLLTETVKQHAKCSAIMDAMLERLQKLENK
jgi:uncharacterized phage infection (PIP) family protein YhgE